MSDEWVAHHEPRGLGDRIAYRTVRVLRFFADLLFAGRYGHRAVVLETVAGVPGMVGGMLLHLRSLRRMEEGHGWIHTLLDEAENERMHLMTFVELAKPTWFERALVMLAQGVFFVSYSLLYLVSRSTAHRMVGYLEEEAVVSYSEYLECIDRGEVENVAAPEIAIEYWDLPADARLRDVILRVREDELRHREVNHCLASKIAGEECEIVTPDNIAESVKEALQKYRSRPVP